MRRLSLLFAVALLALAVAPVFDAADAKKHSAVYACNDGVDNDGDGLTDYPDDTACIGPYDYSELPQCSDGIDNDGSGDIDYPADEACSSPNDDTEQDVPVAGECSDGYDNDLDGAIDYPDDTGCRSAFDQTEKSHNP